MAETKDMIIPMLREIRSEISDFRSSTEKRFDKIEKRFDGIETSQKNFKNALTADTMMGKLVVGDFEERITELERRVATILPAS